MTSTTFSLSGYQIIERLYDSPKTQVYRGERLWAQPIHLDIGRLLLQNTPEEQLDEALFEIVAQLNAGKALIEEVAAMLEEELKAVELYRAGRKIEALVYAAKQNKGVAGELPRKH